MQRADAHDAVDVGEPQVADGAIGVEVPVAHRQAIALEDRRREEVEKEISTLGGWGDFKPLLTEACISHLEPIQKRYGELVTETDYLQQVLREGSEAADEVASRTLMGAKRAMGFTLPGDTKLPKL